MKKQNYLHIALMSLFISTSAIVFADPTEKVAKEIISEKASMSEDTHIEEPEAEPECD